MMNEIKLTSVFLFLCLAVIACNNTTVRSTSTEEIIASAVAIPESQLVDVGVGIFKPGEVNPENEEDAEIYRKIRDAEAHFMAFKLMETLQYSGNWGVVRLIPERQSEMDVWIDATILNSDGETLALDVTVQDASGRIWYTKNYSGAASKYSYDTSTTKGIEPFQDVYNHIANDMFEFYRTLSPDDIRAIRTITELKFAREFSPEVYSNYLETDSKGNVRISRLPPEGDPILQRIRQIRERDYMFVDTLQEYYAAFVRQMEAPYRDWRRAYYEEGMALRQVRSEANTRLIGGALAVLAGILAQGSDSSIARAAGQVGIGAGAGVFWSGLNKREEAKVHAEALGEISASLDAEMEPHTMNLQDRTITLTGTVNDQYSQWRELLIEIYQSETGQLEPANQPQ